LKFRFEANEDSTFECRFDHGEWRACSSPKLRKRTSRGKHRFRVRATDAAGNREEEPVLWKFRVV
jgi:hypothetical protein